MKTKKLITLFALLMAALFVSAQTYMSDEEIAKYEQMMRDNASAVETTTSPLGINLYDLFWEYYFSNFSNGVHPTTRKPDLSTDKPKYTGVPSKYMPPAYNANDDDSPTRNKMSHRPRYPKIKIDGTPYYGGSANPR